MEKTIGTQSSTNRPSKVERKKISPSVMREIRRHEQLAKGIEVSEADDSYALEHSILKNGDLECEHNRWFYKGPFLWAMNVVGFALACLVIPYRRWAPCPEARLGEFRWISAGKMYRVTWVDRVMRRVCGAVMKPIRMTRWLCGPKELNWLLGWLLHPIIFTIREGVTTSQALDAVYAAKRVLQKEFRELKWYQWFNLKAVVGRALTLYTMCSPHPAGVRNRLRSAYESWKFSAETAFQTGEPEFFHIELACGSSECTNHGHWHMSQKYPDFITRQVLVDMSKSSLRRAKRQAEVLGVEDRMKFIRMDMRDYIEQLPDNSVKFVSARGYFDYQSTRGLVSYLKPWRLKLKEGGEIAFSMILKTRYDFMLEHLIGWPILLHKTLREVQMAVWEAGYSFAEMSTTVESTRTHATITLRKLGEPQEVDSGPYRKSTVH